MGYNDRNMWVLHDLHKLAEYKTSTKFQNLIYSYIYVFSRYSGFEIDIPEHITLNSNVSVKDSNEKIVKLLRITQLQVELLELETLRLDSEKRRKQRYRASAFGSKTQEAHLKRQKEKRQELYSEYLKQKETGVTTTQIAKNLNISRGRLYQIINKEKTEETT